MHQPGLKRAACALALGVAAAGVVAIPAGPASAHSGSTAPNSQYAVNLTAEKALTTGHAYRHGVVPAKSATTAARKSLAASPSDNFTFDGKLQYYGGTDGVGVQTSSPKVYIVYVGSQWGTQTVNASGISSFSNDAAGMAPYQQEFFNGVGSNGEKWSRVATQYCQGVAVGATYCPTSALHVGNSSGVLGGVWYDGSTAAGNLTANQIGQEAVAAAAHFGNTTAASNQNAQYVITFPTGVRPDGWDPTGAIASGSFCAWHDYTGDPSMDGGGAVTSAYGDIAFTNMPYLPDVPPPTATQPVGGCLQNAVNSGAAGNLDGVSIVGGHEFVETQTDPFPKSAATGPLISGGWFTPVTDTTTGQVNLEEIADLCETDPVGSTGGWKNLSLSTGTFAVQGLWSNSDHNCSTAVQTTDFNGDMLTDIAGIDANNDMKLYTGNGQGQMAEGGYMWPQGGLWGGFKLITAGDFNGDGCTDIAGIDANNNMKLYLGDCKGHLTEGGYMWPAGGLWGGFKQIVAGDFRGNGVTDIAGIDANNDLRLYTNDGHGHLSGGNLMWPSGGQWAGFKQIVAGDFFGNGITDIAGIDANNNLTGYEGNGQGQLNGVAWAMWPTGGLWAGFKQIIAGDFNGDDITDIAGIDANNNLKLYAGVGDGTLVEGGYMWPSGGLWSGFKHIV